jgi:hypothetical protein
MKKMPFIIIILLMLLSAPILSMASDYSDAGTYTEENVLVPDIYKVDLGYLTGNPSRSYSSSGYGTTTTYVFIKGSPYETAFLSAIENRQEPSALESATNSPGYRVLYVATTAQNFSVNIDDQQINLDGKLIYASETKYHFKSGQSVVITADTEYDALLYSQSDRYWLNGDPLVITKSADYWLINYQFGSRNMFMTYTIEYDKELGENKSNALAAVCIVLGALGVISLVWLGRKQQIT